MSQKKQPKNRNKNLSPSLRAMMRQRALGIRADEELREHRRMSHERPKSSYVIND